MIAVGMDAMARRSELGAFLKARRAAISPDSIGLPRGARRLTPGLRREEVADLAEIGITWYTWLEQGRDINVSASALGRIAGALRLSETDRQYLFSLAGIEAQPGGSSGATDLVSWQQIQVLLDMVRGPAFVMDEIFDVVAFNAIADALYDFDGGTAPFPRNHVWNGFVNPARRRLFVDDEDLRRRTVGAFRLAHAKRAGDPRFEALLDALLESSPDFARLWGERQTAQLTPRTTRLFHPDFGQIEVFSMRFPLEGAGGHFLVFPTPANDETAASFARVAERLREPAVAQATIAIGQP